MGSSWEFTPEIIALASASALISSYYLLGGPRKLPGGQNQAKIESESNQNQNRIKIESKS